MKRILSVLLIMVLMLVAVPLGSAASEINPAIASYYRGDADGDWEVTTADARDILVAVIGGEALASYPRYDVNADGALTSADARDVLVDTVTEATPTLVSPTVTKVDTLPDGEEVMIVESFLPGECAVIADDEVEITTFIVQSLEEFQAVYKNDNIIGLNYTEGYDNNYFNDYAIVLIKIFMLETPKNVYVSGVYRSDTALAIHITEEFHHGTLPAPWGTRIWLEIPKSELEGITDLQMYREEDRPSFE